MELRAASICAPLGWITSKTESTLLARFDVGYNVGDRSQPRQPEVAVRAGFDSSVFTVSET